MRRGSFIWLGLIALAVATSAITAPPARLALAAAQPAPTTPDSAPAPQTQEPISRNDSKSKIGKQDEGLSAAANAALIVAANAGARA